MNQPIQPHRNNKRNNKRKSNYRNKRPKKGMVVVVHRNVLMQTKKYK